MKTYTLIVGDEYGLRGSSIAPRDLTPETLRLRRERLGITRNKLALEAGCAAVTLQKAEYGERSMTVELRRKLTQALERLESETQDL